MDLSLWIIWLAVAVGLGIIELLTGTFFVLCFAIGAGCAAFAAWLGADHPVIWLVFTAVSAIFVAFSRRIAERITGKQERAANADQVIGAQGLVTERIDPVTGEGKVVIDSVRWSAESGDGESIEVDQLISVQGVKGASLVVIKK